MSKKSKPKVNLNKEPKPLREKIAEIPKAEQKKVEVRAKELTAAEKRRRLDTLGHE